jgi:hypothetical protein
MYQENGHVTLLDQTPGKLSSGTIYVYGTDQSLPTDTISNIHNVWTKDGSGGDGRGRLLRVSPFDDGSCYQRNVGPESLRRQNLPQRSHEDFEGDDLWCLTNFSIPEDAVRGLNYTVYWVWDWPTAPSAALPGGKVEVYTTCMDIEII